MPTGDLDDFRGRLRQVLPEGWFPDVAPVLEAALAGPAQTHAWAFALLAWVAQQLRLRTASGGTLDLIAYDFFGGRLARAPGQSDGSLRAAIVAGLFQQGITRQGLIDLLTTLTGSAPRVFEPANAADTGGWGVACGYGVAGGWGAYDLPLTAFVTVRRPASNVTANLGGYGSPVIAYDTPASAGRYLSPDEMVAATTDADIYAAIARAKPVGATIWVAITN